MDYNYVDGKNSINSIFDTKNQIEEYSDFPNNDAEFSFKNGLKIWTASIFVDIADSTKLFSGEIEKDSIVARTLRAFFSEIIKIFKSSKFYFESGIQGDSVFGVFNGNYKENLCEVLDAAFYINTFINMFNVLLKKRGWKQINAGIGVACGKDLVIKAGLPREKNEKVYIGRALVDGANLSKIGGRNGLSRICISGLFYDNIVELMTQKNKDFKSWVSKKYYKNGFDIYYNCDVVKTKFSDWVENGMKDE